MKVYLVIEEYYNIEDYDYDANVTPCLTEEAANNVLGEAFKDELMAISERYEGAVNYEDLVKGGCFKYDAETERYVRVNVDCAYLYADFEIIVKSNFFEYHDQEMNVCVRIEEKFVKE